MLTKLWRLELQSPAIDCSIDASFQTVAAGDLSGNIIVSDYYGNIFLKENVSAMPIWGIDHTHLSDGSLLLVTGHASKNPKAGEVRIAIDDREIARHSFDDPIWDVKIIKEENKVFASSWGGKLYQFDLKDSTREEWSFDRPVFGLCRTPGGIIANIERKGAFSIIDGSASKIFDSKSNAFNISTSPQDMIVISGGYGPYLEINRTDTNASVGRFDSSDIVSVVASSGAIITGAFGGEVSIRTVENHKSPFFTTNIGGDVWNISLDMESEKLFIASGDGTLTGYHCEMSHDTAQSIDRFFTFSRENPSAPLDQLVSLEAPSVVVVPELLARVKAKRYTPNDAEFALKKISFSHHDPIISAIVAFAANDYQTAIDGLQTVESDSVHYGAAVSLLIEAFIMSGNIDGARQYIASNSHRMPTEFVGAAMRALELRRDAKKTKSSSAKKLHDTLVFPDVMVGSHDADADRVEYDVISYMKYEYANRADRAKKVLEKNKVESYLRHVAISQSIAPVSLDIGCATCRYPLWFSEIGFQAVGYDINDEAIRICKMRAEGNPRIHIEKKNILEHPPEQERFTIVTCMMGTFNHIPRQLQRNFVQWVFDSLRVGGRFIFSSWNLDCSYTSHLYFYTREEKENIVANCMKCGEIESMLKDAGFRVVNCDPASYLPDECYEAWLGEMNDSDIIDIDTTLSKKLKSRNAQMIVFCGVKP